MTEHEAQTGSPDLCVAGLAFFEIHVPVDRIPEQAGVERFVDTLPVGAGGALNTASVAHALGQNVLVAFPSGRGLTDAAVHRAVERMELSVTTWRSEADPAISVVVSRGDDRSFLSRADYDGLAGCPGLPDARRIHVPGLEEAERLEDQLREARDRGARTSVAASWCPDALRSLTEERRRPWDLLVLNEKEFREATGETSLEPERLSHVARDVIVTNGADSVVASLDGEEHEIGVDRFEVVDATGAGDAFCAGFLSARLDGAAPRDALSFASRVAGRTVSQRGGIVEDASLFEEIPRPHTG